MDAFVVFLVALLVIGIVALAIVSLIGTYYFTIFSFNHDSVGDVRSYELKDWQLDMMKASAVLSWIGLGLNLLAAAYQAGTRTT